MRSKPRLALLAWALVLAVGSRAGAQAPDDALSTTGADETEDGEQIIERVSPAEAGAEPVPDDLPEKAAARGTWLGRVRTEFVEVSAGPGGAYTSRGRLYQNDKVDVLRRNAAGDWLEIQGDGLKGWVRARFIQLTRGAAGAERHVDAGRARRESNYRYDEHGRRLRSDGKPMGSGEGAGAGVPVDVDEAADAEAPPEAEPAPEVEPPVKKRAGLGLRPSLSFGFGQVRRVFDSDIAQQGLEASPLIHASAKPSGLALSAALAYAPPAVPVLSFEGRFDGVFLGKTTIAAAPELGLERALSLEISGWQAALDARGALPLGPVRAGLSAGGRAFRQNFQRTRQFPLFLTDTLLSLAGGLFAEAAFGPVEIRARGGVALPLSISQSPSDSGSLDGGLGLEAAAALALPLRPWFSRGALGALAVELGGFYTREKLEFKGASSQKDTVNGPEPVGYTRARQTDTLLGLTLGVGARF